MDSIMYGLTIILGHPLFFPLYNRQYKDINYFLEQHSFIQKLKILRLSRSNILYETSISPAYDLIQFLVHLFAKSGRIFPEQARRHFKINQWLRKRSDITDIFEDSDIASKWALDM